MDEDIGVDEVAMVMVMAGRREKQVLTPFTGFSFSSDRWSFPRVWPIRLADCVEDTLLENRKTVHL